MGNVGIDNSSDFISASNLFPVPASDKVTIDFTLKENQKVVVRLFNAIGQQVETDYNADGIQGLNSISTDVACLPEGIYFAQIILNNTVAATKRFVVEK